MANAGEGNDSIRVQEGALANGGSGDDRLELDAGSDDPILCVVAQVVVQSPVTVTFD
jgi:hypothetical protein